MREIKFRAWTGEKMVNDVYKEYGILMQYTGLKDKNGKEVFESDIVKYIERNLSNAFGGNGEPWNERVELIRWFNYGFIAPMGFVKEIEVIGNIYENPELLEGAENE